MIMKNILIRGLEIGERTPFIPVLKTNFELPGKIEIHFVKEGFKRPGSTRNKLALSCARLRLAFPGQLVGGWIEWE